MKIVVLAGGLSTERDVSINSGTQVCRALRKKGHKAVLLDIFLGYGEEGDDLTGVFEGKERLTELSDTISASDPDLDYVKSLRKNHPECLFGPNVLAICQRADIVYMGLHGADGENGKVQAVLDLYDIPYTGSGCLGSAMAMDKVVAKKVLQASGIPVPGGYCVTRETIGEKENDPARVGFPCVVKPCYGGSSVGVSIPQNQEEYRQALELAFRYDKEVIVEQYIKGREFSVGVLAGEVLPVIEIIPKDGFYDYETKYQAGMALDVCPAELDKKLTEKMQQLALAAYRELKLQVYGRIDFLMNEKNEMFCLEANTLPGMTPTSLLPQEAKAVGIEYGDLCEKIINEAMKKYQG
jgi:D-alanine-D-alanine ligase